MTYVYRRADGSEFEADQRMSDAPLATCPTTGQACERIIVTTARPAFKGSHTPIHHVR